MAAFEELIDQLRAEGDFDSEGAFTLDREKAREKMRHFQLADPRSYVVELLQAAVLVGATEVEFEVDADDMHMRFDGRSFDREDLEQLYGAMFSRDESSVLGARRQLALGLNAAMGLGPKYAHVRTGALHMELRPDEPDQIRQSEEPVQGTQIHVHEPFRSETIRRFVRNLGAKLAEIEHLERRCVRVKPALSLNGERFEPPAPLPASAVQIALAEPGVRGVAGITHEPARASTLVVLKHGVLITTASSEALPPGFVAVFEADALRKDMSQTGIVRDVSWARALRAVKRAALWPLLRGLAERAGQDATSSALFRRTVLHGSSLAEMRRGVSVARRGGAPDAAFTAVSEVPLWPNAIERPPSVALRVSLADVIAALQRHDVADFTSRAMAEPVPWTEERPVPVITDEAEIKYLSRLLGRPMRDLADDLDAAILRAKNVARWRARQMKPEIPLPAADVVKVPFTVEGAVGEVGVHVAVAATPAFWLIKDGCLLERRSGGGELMPALVAALEADFTPSKKHDHVACDKAFLRIVLEVALALPALMSTLAAAEHRGLTTAQRELALRKLLLPYLAMDFGGEGLAQWLALWRLTEQRTVELARTLLRERPPLPSVETLQSDSPPAYARVAVFRVYGGGRRTSLAGVARELAQHAALAYVPEKVAAEATPASRTLLLVDDLELAALRRVFGAARLHDSTDELRAERGRLRHESRSTMEIELDDRGVLAGRFHDGGVSGHLCLLAPYAPAVTVQAEVRLLRQQRWLDVIRFPAPIGPIAAVVNDDQLRPNADWDGVIDDERVGALRARVVREAALLLATRCRLGGRDGAQHRKLLLNAAARLYGGRHEREPWAAELVATLERQPLFGDATGKPVTLAQIRQELARAGSVLYVGARSTVPDDAGRMVLALDPEERLVLEAVLGSVRPNALELGEAWLTERARAAHLRESAPLAPTALAPGEVLVRVPIEAPGVRGEVGLARVPGPLRTELRLCHQGRLLTRWNAGSTHALIAIVEDRQLPFDDTGRVDLASPRLRELATLAIERVPALITKLLDRGAPSAAEDAAVFTHVVDFLAFEARRTDEPSAETRAAHERARQAKVFRAAGGDRSFEQLQAAYARFGEQAYLPTELPGQPLDARRTVLIADREQLRVVSRLFPSMRNFAMQWTREQWLAEATADWRPLPEPPTDALACHAGSTPDNLQAELWLPDDPRDPLQCTFGAFGKAIATRALSTLFPCAGRVQGEALSFGQGTIRLDLSEAQRESLERLSFELYRQLADELRERALTQEPQGARVERARALLDRAATAYAALDDASALSDEYRAFFEARAASARDAAPRSPADREALLVQALREALGWVADKHAELLDPLNLDRIAIGNLGVDLVARCGTHGVTVNRRHPLVAELLGAARRDPLLLAWLASSVYTAMNHFWAEIEDDHEREFQAALIEDVIGMLSARTRPGA